MKVLLSITIILIASFFSSRSFAQYNYVGTYEQNSMIKKWILVDSSTMNQFVLSKDGKYITAYNGNGDTLWNTNPIEANKIEPYRNRNRFIIYFDFAKDNKYCTESIAISYNNSQFGCVEKRTGNFTFMGQD